MIIKQCTKLLPYDTSLYTVYAVFDEYDSGIKDIDMRNDRVSKEMKIYLDKNDIIYADHEAIKGFVTAMKGTSLFLCSDGTETSASALHIIVEILAKDDTEPLVIESRKEITTPFWEVALQYNHTVSSVAHTGFGGGIDSPAEYESLKDIVSKETYDRYVLSCCIDDRRLPQFWTPYSPDQEELESVKSIAEDDVFKIEVISPNVLHRKRHFNE